MTFEESDLDRVLETLLPLASQKLEQGSEVSFGAEVSTSGDIRLVPAPASLGGDWSAQMSAFDAERQQSIAQGEIRGAALCEVASTDREDMLMIHFENIAESPTAYMVPFSKKSDGTIEYGKSEYLDVVGEPRWFK